MCAPMIIANVVNGNWRPSYPKLVPIIRIITGFCETIDKLCGMCMIKLIV